jgi:hypothetical protein
MADVLPSGKSAALIEKKLVENKTISTEDIFASRVYEEDIPLDDWRKAWAVFESTDRVIVIDPRALIAKQERINSVGVRKAMLLGADDRTPVDVLLVGDKPYLSDGHHRAAAAIMKGESIKAKVVRMGGTPVAPIFDLDARINPMADEDRSDRPTAPTGLSYEGIVRRTLVDLGSPDPDGDLTRSGDYWKNCRDAGVDPVTTAAVIYGSIRHKHSGGPTSLKEKVTEGATESGAAAPTPLGHEWEVIVRRTGSMEKIKHAAKVYGRPMNTDTDAVVGNHVIFGGFYDDEKAWVFARHMTDAGFVASYGPRRDVEAAEGGVSRAEDKGALRWTEIWWQFAPDATKFADALEKINSTIVASATNRIVRTNATAADISKTIKKHRWSGNHILNQSSMVVGASEGDSSAMGAAEMAPVISEASEVAPVIHEGSIPWVKVERNPKVHESVMALAEKHGPIRTPLKVYELVGADLAKDDQEVFLVIPLNLRGELKGPPYEVARGQRSRVTVDPADVLRAALDAGAEGYICCHSHPTGKCKPSKADIDLTNTLKAATKPYGTSLCLVDHVVIGHGECFSIFENKMYKVPK